ncbi:MAG: hypothetical protein QM492_00730 [Rhodobacterales bacterium]
MGQVSVRSVQLEIGKLVAKKYGLKGRDLQKLVSQLRGRLPRGFKADVAYLFAAQERIKHPKRRGQVDLDKLRSVRRVAMAKLEGVDLEPDKSRKRALWLAEFAARMLLFFASLVAVLYWLGVNRP